MTSIKNWKKFQHFRDRRPPWIKLYRELLDDLDWHELEPKAAKVLVMLWLIASENDGNLPEIKNLAFRLRMSEKDAMSCVDKLSHWLDQDDISVISTRYQDDLPETETETEIEKRQNSLSGTTFPPCPHQEILNLWKKNLPHLAQPRSWEGNRVAMLKSRWIQAAKPSPYSEEGYATVAEGLEWWDSFFAYLAKHTNLAKGFESNGRVWRPDLPWVLNATNFQKIVDGKYDK
jgi:hypothetical protein